MPPGEIPTPVKIVARTTRLKSLPACVQRVLDELSKRRASAVEIGKILADDPPLVARVLSIANSGLYSRGNRVESVGAAITRIGFKEVRNIVTTAALKDLLPREPTAFPVAEIYAKAVACGRLASSVSEGLEKPEADMFTAGLLQDIGVFAMYAMMPDVLCAWYEIAKQRGCSLIEVEQQEWGHTHAEVSARLLQRWRFGDREVEVARWYPTPEKAPPRFQRAAAIVQLTNYALKEAGVLPAILHEGPRFSGDSLIQCGLSMDAVELAGSQAQTAVQEAEELLRALSGTELRRSA